MKMKNLEDEKEQEIENIKQKHLIENDEKEKEIRNTVIRD